MVKIMAQFQFTGTASEPNYYRKLSQSNNVLFCNNYLTHLADFRLGDLYLCLDFGEYLGLNGPAFVL